MFRLFRLLTVFFDKLAHRCQQRQVILIHIPIILGRLRHLVHHLDCLLVGYFRPVWMLVYFLSLLTIIIALVSKFRLVFNWNLPSILPLVNFPDFRHVSLSR